MNKEKQIEEMAKAVEQARIKATDTTNSMNYGFGGWYAKELYNAGYRKASEVAREIINDTKDTLLDYHLQENKKYLKCQSKTKKQFETETARYRAITDAIKFAIETLNEIEKKYTEEGK